MNPDQARAKPTDRVNNAGSRYFDDEKRWPKKPKHNKAIPKNIGDPISLKPIL